MKSISSVALLLCSVQAHKIRFTGDVEQSNSLDEMLNVYSTLSQKVEKYETENKEIIE